MFWEGESYSEYRQSLTNAADKKIPDSKTRQDKNKY